jgi:alkanesulfonate monooxygenase SsuD/methylene tetrahydromethanopterin reductase-like flavin-dependent oxidoreductase (luciferase family)
VNRSRLKVGIQLPEVEYVASWREHLEMATIAEEIGLDSLWLGDHLLYRSEGQPARGPWECWSMLSALAAVTTRVELGPLVLAAGFRNPALVAKMAATVDEISGGRLILGLGAGWNPPEYDAFGIPYDHRFSRFAEAFHITRSLLRDGRVDFKGKFHEANNCEIRPRGPRPGRIPLMVGTSGEKMLRLTLPHVDLWNIWYADFGNTIEGLRPFMANVDAICREVGRDPREVERTAALLVTAPGGSYRSAGAVKEQAIKGISGSPRDIAETFLAYHEAGIDHIQVVLDPITPTTIAWLAPAITALKDLSTP